MTGFAVDDAALFATSFQLDVVVDELETQFAVVRDQLDRVLGTWSGGAARSFGIGWAEWLEGYGAAVTALRSMASLLQSTGTTYAGSESSTQGTVTAVGAML